MTALAYAYDPAEGPASMPTAQRAALKLAYDRAQGHILQTDPVGYEDDMNLYAYVRNDPINGYDPTGQYTCGGGGDEACPDAVNTAVSDINNAAQNASDATTKSQLGELGSFFGAEGEANGVNFVVGEVQEGALMNAFGWRAERSR